MLRIAFDLICYANMSKGHKESNEKDYSVIGVTIPHDMLRLIDRLARSEMRTRSSMMRVLLSEAIKARGVSDDPQK